MGDLVNQQEVFSLNGIIIYANMHGKFILEKISTQKNDSFQDKLEYKSFDDATAAGWLLVNRQKEWQAIVRYDRGLGIEYKNIFSIFALTKEEAKIIALNNAEKILKDSTIIEVKLRQL